MLTQFENLELFSIISVEQEAYFRDRGILRRILSLDLIQEKRIRNRVLNRMKEIPHFNAFIQERGMRYSKMYVSEAMEWFYDTISVSLGSIKDQREPYFN